MSTPHIAWALKVGRDRQLQPSERLVLMVLAERANGALVCWPSHSRLGLDTGLSRRTVQTVVHRLDDLGLIRIRPDETEGRALTYEILRPADCDASASLQVTTEEPVQPLHRGEGEPVQPLHPLDPKPVQPLHRGGCATIAHQSLKERIKVSKNPSGADARKTGDLFPLAVSTEVAIVAPAEQVIPAAPLIVTELFTLGLAILRDLVGKSEPQLRSLLGKFRKAANDDSARVMAALRDAADRHPADPIAFITGSLQRSGLSKYDQIRAEIGGGHSFLALQIDDEEMLQ